MLLLGYSNSGIAGKGIEGVSQVIDIIGEVESSGDNDLTKEGKLTDVVVPDLCAEETVCSWETLYNRGGHGADRGGRGPFSGEGRGVWYRGLALVGLKCSPLIVVYPSIFVPCLPFPWSISELSMNLSGAM